MPIEYSAMYTFFFIFSQHFRSTHFNPRSVRNFQRAYVINRYTEITTAINTTLESLYPTLTIDWLTRWYKNSEIMIIDRLICAQKSIKRSLETAMLWIFYRKKMAGKLWSITIILGTKGLSVFSFVKLFRSSSADWSKLLWHSLRVD